MEDESKESLVTTSPANGYWPTAIGYVNNEMEDESKESLVTTSPASGYRPTAIGFLNNEMEDESKETLVTPKHCERLSANGHRPATR